MLNGIPMYLSNSWQSLENPDLFIDAQREPLSHTSCLAISNTSNATSTVCKATWMLYTCFLESPSKMTVTRRCPYNPRIFMSLNCSEAGTWAPSESKLREQCFPPEFIAELQIFRLLALILAAVSCLLNLVCLGIQAWRRASHNNIFIEKYMELHGVHFLYSGMDLVFRMWGKSLVTTKCHLETSLFVYCQVTAILLVSGCGLLLHRLVNTTKPRVSRVIIAVRRLCWIPPYLIATVYIVIEEVQRSAVFFDCNKEIEIHPVYYPVTGIAFCASLYNLLLVGLIGKTMHKAGRSDVFRRESARIFRHEPQFCRDLVLLCNKIFISLTIVTCGFTVACALPLFVSQSFIRDAIILCVTRLYGIVICHVVTIFWCFKAARTRTGTGIFSGRNVSIADNICVTTQELSVDQEDQSAQDQGEMSLEMGPLWSPSRDAQGKENKPEKTYSTTDWSNQAQSILYPRKRSSSVILGTAVNIDFEKKKSDKSWHLN